MIAEDFHYTNHTLHEKLDIQEAFMSTMSFRFNKQMEEELKIIQEELKANKTEVLRQVLHCLYSQIISSKKKESIYDYLEKAGLIGGFSDEKDLSTNYKSIIGELWLKK